MTFPGKEPGKVYRKLLRQKKTEKALYYSEKEDDPRSRKLKKEIQVPGSKLAQVIQCMIWLDHFELVTRGELPAKYPWW